LGRFFPNVGAVTTIQVVDSTQIPYKLGSGVLIAPEWVLTAAHLLDPLLTIPEEDPVLLTEVTFGNKAYHSVELFQHGDWDNNAYSGYDIGLIHLDEPVEGIRPAPRFRGTWEQGRLGIPVGFGMTGTGETGFVPGTYGDKRAGTNRVDVFEAGDRRDARLLMVDFDNPDDRDDSVYGSPKPTGLEILSAAGDSGGGLFIGRQLAGITSFVDNVDGSSNSDYGDMVGFTRVSHFNDWINEIMAGGPTGPGEEPWPPHRPWWSRRWCSAEDPSGVLTPSGSVTIGDEAFASSSAQFLSVQIPEPATLALLACGGLALVRRRRR